MGPTREQLLSLVETIGVGVTLVHVPDPDDPESMRILLNNPAASEASQADLRPMVGKLFLEAFPAIRGTPFPDLYARVVREQTVVELPDIAYGDALVPEAVFSVRLCPLPGNLVLGEYVNKTLQERAEARLRRFNEALEDLVAKRTLALEMSQEALERVSWVAAHDLQTPLFTIAGYLGAILEELEQRGDDELTPMVRRAEAAATRLRERVIQLIRESPAEIIPESTPRPER